MYGIDRKLSMLVTIVAVLSLLLGYLAMSARAETPTPTPTPPPVGSALVAISEFKVLTIDGKDTAAPLMAGSSYRVDFTLDVAQGVKDKVILETDMKLAGGQYQVFWELVGEYKGINTATWTPGSNQVSFDSVVGKAKFILRGAIADDFNLRIEADGKTSTKLDGQVIHQKKPIRLLRLSTASGTISDEKKADVIDKSIETFNATLAAKNKVVEQQNGLPEYQKLVKSNIARAQDLAKLGLTDTATALLTEIPDKGWPQPAGSNTILYIIAGVLGIAALAFFFLMVKARGATSYVYQTVDDQVKRMDIIATKAGRLGDKALVQEINTVKDELEKISGR